jgi:phosphomannomutase
MSVIKFGTDGWRAVIAEEFTFDNVRVCAAAVARHFKHQMPPGGELVVGHDTRFGSREFAIAVVEVVTAAGIPAILLDGAIPTPVVSYTIVKQSAMGGVVITASHNPGDWNGFKYKSQEGGSASPLLIENLERHIEEIETDVKPLRLSLEEAESKGLLRRVDPRSSYISHLNDLVDVKSIRNAGLVIVADAMHGAGAGYFPELLGGGSSCITEIRGERNPAFPGMSQPEPVAHNLEPLFTSIKEQGAQVGLALDGDADRIGASDEDGRFITPLQVFALLALYFLEIRGERGPIVKSLTSTAMLYRLGELYQVPIIETPIGFKHIGVAMLEHGALMGGEESGGYGFREHIPERDGILSGLFLLDMMVKTGKSLSQLLQWLYQIVGPHEYIREDIPFSDSRRQELLRRLENVSPSQLAGFNVEGRDVTDGLRFSLTGGAWVVIRFSGTEPLLRIYAESESQEQAGQLIKAIRVLAEV